MPRCISIRFIFVFCFSILLFYSMLWRFLHVVVEGSANFNWVSREERVSVLQRWIVSYESQFLLHLLRFQWEARNKTWRRWMTKRAKINERKNRIISKLIFLWVSCLMRVITIEHFILNRYLYRWAHRRKVAKNKSPHRSISVFLYFTTFEMRYHRRQSVWFRRSQYQWDSFFSFCLFVWRFVWFRSLFTFRHGNIQMRFFFVSFHLFGLR